ncbi:MAG: hypothetical protein F4X82_02695 [Candidatus Spechtbacteria bacterium SB0662_bin_43]|uniref:Uncharacterized protein n=1 Tax=Candidatus Spechtbacteria bacterium SB0662_bin_43 TaxID=2604897 RepID=A0A845DBH3_9BACT|nr:hypothetical protein [Candidatus Spechtbacteria bacterium SB0662_bin_43]
MRLNHKRYILFLVSSILVLLLIIPLYLFVFTEEDNIQAIQNQASLTFQETIQNQNTSEKESHPLKQCFTLQEGRDACYFDFCKKENPYLCAEELLDTIVRIEGPEQAMVTLQDIMESQLFGIQTDGHQLSHIVGRATPRYYGISPESFMRCPLSFDRGCQHGFFQDAFEKYKTPLETAIAICKKDSDCYHGVGHGFVFHTSYNLMDALSLCDQLSSLKIRESCYSGVFMENMTGFFKKTDGELGFVEGDILAPCNRVEDRYYKKCWLDHGRYVLFHHNWSLQEALHFCLGAGSHTRGCILSLGWIITLMEPRELLRGSFEGTSIQTTVYLCNQFPYEYIETCQQPTIRTFLSTDGTDIQKRAVEFCLSFQVGIHNCFKIIGADLFEFIQDADEIMRACNKAPEEYRESCYEGWYESMNIRINTI